MPGKKKRMNTKFTTNLMRQMKFAKAEKKKWTGQMKKSKGNTKRYIKQEILPELGSEIRAQQSILRKTNKIQKGPFKNLRQRRVARKMSKKDRKAAVSRDRTSMSRRSSGPKSWNAASDELYARSNAARKALSKKGRKRSEHWLPTSS